MRYTDHMTHSLGSLLDTDRFKQPPEIKIIKDFVRQTFDADAQVTIQERTITIGVHGSALAGALRPYIWQLTKECGTTKRLLIRIE